MQESQTDQTRKVINTFYTAIDNGEVREALGLLSDDFEVTQPPYLPYGGTHRGVPGLKAVFRAVGGWMIPASAEVQFVVVDGDTAVSTAHSRVIGTNAEVVAIEIWRVRDGELTECRVSFHDPRPILAALSSDEGGEA
ncbi:nuclear transport factor 2 family protein [Rhodococcus ruber]|uniref:Nuclear transport factor 2 family protein n=1 Tax=Rhodococcus ruber TaxID=1830 RepID=A0ABT4MEQ2_9NOCA|nr:nuclear transport factor 2 family protein [Rhodococcus ruber]MCZ4519463.1 nuclear transport factor 2 family protein [Rhodococcus ruber]